MLVGGQIGKRRASVLEWLTTVAIHEALRLDGTDRRRAPLQAAGEPSIPSTTLTHERAREALEVVAALPTRQRQLVGLHAAGFTYDEIAALTATSHRAVDRHLRRARAVLRHS
jgi:DNA-directed RNA polymerase specialized sigma24 family protein